MRVVLQGMCLSVCDDLQGAMGKKQKEEPAEEAEEEVEDPDMSESALEDICIVYHSGPLRPVRSSISS